MGILVIPSRYLTAKGGIAIRKVGHAQHAIRSSRYGSPTASAPTDVELRTYRKLIRSGLRHYSESKPVRAALEVATEFLDYSLAPGRAGVVAAAEELERLRSAGVTPFDVLQRVCEVYALMLFNDRFDDSRELEQYLPRAVMKLAKRRTPKRPTAHCRRTLAHWLKSSLERFALHFLLKMERNEAVEKLRQEALLSDFD